VERRKAAAARSADPETQSLKFFLLTNQGRADKCPLSYFFITNNNLKHKQNDFDYYNNRFGSYLRVPYRGALSDAQETYSFKRSRYRNFAGFCQLAEKH